MSIDRGFKEMFLSVPNSLRQIRTAGAAVTASE